MKTIARSVQATTEKGTLLTLNVTVTRGFENVKETSFADGWNVDVTKGKVTNTTECVISANGTNYTGHFTTKVPSSMLKGCYGLFITSKQPLGLSREVYNILNNCVIEAVAEAETDESYQAYLDRKKAHYAAEAEYDRQTRLIDNAMTLNGKTY